MIPVQYGRRDIRKYRDTSNLGTAEAIRYGSHYLPNGFHIIPFNQHSLMQNFAVSESRLTPIITAIIVTKIISIYHFCNILPLVSHSISKLHVMSITTTHYAQHFVWLRSQDRTYITPVTPRREWWSAMKVSDKYASSKSWILSTRNKDFYCILYMFPTYIKHRVRLY